MESALVAAILDSDYEECERLIAVGVNPEPLTTAQGEPLLHHSVRTGDITMVNILLDGGCAVNRHHQDGQTPLHVAVREGNVLVSKTLLEAGADVHLTTDQGQSALYIACKENHTSLVSLLVEYKAASHHTECSRVNYPLHIAVSNKNTDIVRILLGGDAGIDVNTLDDVGDSPLCLGVRQANLEMVSLLLKHGADPNYQPTVRQPCREQYNTAPTVRQPCREQYNTALSMAVDMELTAIMVKLVDNGALVNNPTHPGVSQMILTVGKYSARVLECLIKIGGDVNMFIPERLPETVQRVLEAAGRMTDNHARQEACQMVGYMGSTDDEKSLLRLRYRCGRAAGYLYGMIDGDDAGDEVVTEYKSGFMAGYCGDLNDKAMSKHKTGYTDCRQVAGETPRYQAAYQSGCRARDSLLYSGRSTPQYMVGYRVGYASGYRVGYASGCMVKHLPVGHSPLLSALSYRPSHDLVMTLLRHGARVNVINREGYTPLHMAVQYKMMKVTERLLQLGAFLHVRTRNGHTPIHTLLHGDSNHGNDMRLLLLLLQHGYPIYPHHIPAEYNSTDVSHILTTQGLWSTSRPVVHDPVNEGAVSSPPVHHSALTLSVLVRRVIRDHMMSVEPCRSICPSISKLPLPRAMRHYLLLKAEVDEINQITNNQQSEREASRYINLRA